MARMVFSNSASISQPSISAPRLMYSREQPAAKVLSLNFLLNALYLPCPITLLDGRIKCGRADQPGQLVGTAKSTLSIMCSGATSAADAVAVGTYGADHILARRRPPRSSSGAFLAVFVGI